MFTEGTRMFLDDEQLAFLADVTLSRCRAEGVKLVTAESCTGGLAAAWLTSSAGSSDVFERGFVTYSNEAKTELLGVPAELIAEHGAVSEETACAMAEGALARSRADIALSVTGIAGPGGGSDLKPVGLVHFAAAYRRNRDGGVELLCQTKRFGDLGRDNVRRQAVATALKLALTALVERDAPAPS
jgi:nicotinamide-nucleotide amidase